MKSCYIYVRVSTEEQAKFGYSIAAQKKSCIEYAKKISYHVVDIFSDEGETATAIERPGFQEMLNQCEEHPVDAILVWHTDRFARNETDHFLVREKLSKLGVTLLSVTQPMLDESPEGRLLDTVLAGVNAFYSRDLSRKTKKGLNQKWAEGWWPGWAPLGYRNKKNKHEKGIVVIDSDKSQLVKEGLILFSTGNYTVKKLQQWFFEKGLRSLTGKILQFSVVHNLLTNPFYYGLMRWNSMEKIGNHDPLIDKPTYLLNQYILAKHRGFMIRQRKHDFLLRQFIFCDDCNLRYTAEWHYNEKKLAKRGGKIAYYHCAKRGGCISKYVQMEELEKQVESQFTQLEFSPAFIEAVRIKAKEYLEGNRKNINKQKQGILNQKKSLELKRDRLEDRLLDNTITRDTFRRKHSQIESQITALDGRVAELEQKRQLDVTFIDEVLALSRNIYQTYKDAPDFLKRHYIRFFFEKFFVKDKVISNTILSPLFSVLVRQNLGYIKTCSAPPRGFEPRTFFLQ